MYQSVSLGITESQLQSLLAGDKIFLEKSQFSGDTAVPLTAAQARSVASATRGIRLKLSSRQIKAMQTGEGWVTDKIKEYLPKIAKVGVPLARRIVQTGLDAGQAMIPTYMAGPFKPFADGAVSAGRKKLDQLLEAIQKMYGGKVGIAAVDAQYGSGFFRQKLLPAIEKVATIMTPYIQEGGEIRNMHRVIDLQLGQGFFDNLLSAVETTAKVAGPFMRGRGFESHHDMTGYGFFDKLMSIVKPIARVGSNFVPGLPGIALRGGLSLLGNGIEKKEPFSGKGLLL